MLSCSEWCSGLCLPKPRDRLHSQQLLREFQNSSWPSRGWIFGTERSTRKVRLRFMILNRVRRRLGWDLGKAAKKKSWEQRALGVQAIFVKLQVLDIGIFSKKIKIVCEHKARDDSKCSEAEWRADSADTTVWRAAVCRWACPVLTVRVVPVARAWSYVYSNSKLAPS